MYKFIISSDRPHKRHICGCIFLFVQVLWVTPYRNVQCTFYTILHCTTLHSLHTLYCTVFLHSIELHTTGVWITAVDGVPPHTSFIMNKVLLFLFPCNLIYLSTIWKWYRHQKWPPNIIKNLFIFILSTSKDLYVFCFINRPGVAGAVL